MTHLIRLFTALVVAGCAAEAPDLGVSPPLAVTPMPEASAPAIETRVPPLPDPAAVDRALAARVENALAGDPTLRDAIIEAEARGGRVTLTGTVPTFHERAYAIDAALRVPGVKSVRPRLLLELP